MDIGDYSLVWDYPSVDPRDSMPVGNGDIGGNVLVQKNGDILIYVGKSDAWDEYSRLLKVGKIRIKFTPNLFEGAENFQQILNFAKGEIVIRYGEEPNNILIRIWVDALNSVIRVEAQSGIEFQQEATLEMWRVERRELKGIELHSACGMYGRNAPVFVEPDTILKDSKESVLWYHHNNHSIWQENLSIIGLKESKNKLKDPLSGRIFGACMRGDGFLKKDEFTLVSSKPRKNSSVGIYVNTAINVTPSEWIKNLMSFAQADAENDIEQARVLHQNWWHNFWNRSWIYASGCKDAEEATRLYLSLRYMNACAGRGAAPIKFNGSLFTVDVIEDSYYAKAGFDSDFRLWGGGYFWQNTRLIYWTMLKAGDYDMMLPLFDMYRNAMPVAKERVKKFFHHGGVCFPEHMYFWGTQPNSDYGWEHDPNGLGKHEAVRYYWQGGIELVTMMLDYYEHTQDQGFAKKYLVPIAEAVIEFYDSHYPKTKEGEILFKPAQSLESWIEAVNPLPEIAGLKFITSRLCTLPDTIISSEQKKAWIRVKEQLPSIPMINTFQLNNYKQILAPAAVIGNQHNVENPQLYAVFPYRIFGVGRPQLEMARLSYKFRHNRGNVCWMQDEIFAAHLGLVEEAQRGLSVRVSNKDQATRFTGFAKSPWETFPDIDGGSVMMIAFQAMLLQTDGDKLLLLPAWPGEWDVQFKLHAPNQTTVEGDFIDSKLVRLHVDPASRKQDIIVPGEY